MDENSYLNPFQKQPKEVLIHISRRVKTLRKEQGFSQKELAARSGVSFGSLQRFEQTGLISLESLLRIAFCLDCIDSFDAIFPIEKKPKHLEDLFK